MRTKTTVWTRRLALVFATAALGVLLSASVSSAAPTHHRHAAADGSWTSPAFFVRPADGSWT